MNLKINSEVFAETLKIVEKAVNAKHSIPILQGIHMEVTMEELIFIGSDGTESLRFHVPVDGENVEVFEPGKTVLPKQVSEIAKKLKKELTITLDGFNLNIRYGKGKKSEFNLNTYDPEEYPRLPKVDIESPTFTLKGTDFTSFIKKTAYAASTSETRPILQGVLLEVADNCMSFICTDSHRLGQIKVKTELNCDSFKIVIPAKSLDKLSKMFDMQEEVAVYCDSNNQVVFRNGPLFFYSRLLEGNYPDTSRLIPHEFKAEMKIDKKSFFNSIDRINEIAKNGDNGQSGVIQLHVNGVATLSSKQTQIGKGVDEVEYESLEGEDDFSIFFSAKYMLDALKAVDDDYVMFKYQGNMRPFLITPCESSTEEEIQLVLPVRTY